MIALDIIIDYAVRDRLTMKWTLHQGQYTLDVGEKPRMNIEMDLAEYVRFRENGLIGMPNITGKIVVLQTQYISYSCKVRS